MSNLLHLVKRDLHKNPCWEWTGTRVESKVAGMPFFHYSHEEYDYVIVRDPRKQEAYLEDLFEFTTQESRSSLYNYMALQSERKRQDDTQKAWEDIQERATTLFPNADLSLHSLIHKSNDWAIDIENGFYSDFTPSDRFKEMQEKIMKALDSLPKTNDIFVDIAKKNHYK